MDKTGRALLEQAISESVMVTLRYFAPLRGGIVTRHVRAYELSVNQSGRPTLWATDHLHGARQIHSFRLDRIIEVRMAERPKGFRPASSVTRWLDSWEFSDEDDTL